MLSAISTSIPHIRISPASPVKAYREPYSPFLSAGNPDKDDSGYRPQSLSPQYHFPAISPRHSSPLRPADCPPREFPRDQFDLLLEVSRDKRAALGSRKVPDLRKELAIKNQRNKQLERRAFLLSRIQEPTLPTAGSKTPVETPGVDHCPLPSLGLGSPSFYSSAEHDGWIGKDLPGYRTRFEQADCRLPISKPKADLNLGRRKLPSLEEITARVGPLHPPPSMTNEPIFATPRLPMFLRGDRNSSTTRTVSDTKPSINIGRLHMPVRRRQSSDSLSYIRPSAIPSSPCYPNIEIASPRACGNAICAFTESNMHALGRANTAREMMTTIKRRTSPPLPCLANHQPRPKRHSAPAEMQLRGRSGFEHPILSLPGAF
ncbi:hypothetical protein DFJ58DRAFT_115136 [Suillus subalutaceus]|uniref:uncharacterized protein n=1 Tax=Suillus subalutaceus TaxID=48586 RepID=UPI001B87EA1A|nr:uncharacterized protein DFJ58DRAFT_115136 [Suillus subalutaceus]KAG1867851.1 hypothetical protein DFJ58DRAFT_115136 [Suillus subalutaceus]